MALRSHLSRFFVNKSLLLPSEGALANLSRLEVEILSKRLSSPNYKPFVPSQSLFDKQTVDEMIPREVLCKEESFNRERQQEKVISSFVS